MVQIITILKLLQTILVARFRSYGPDLLQRHAVTTENPDPPIRVFCILDFNSSYLYVQDPKGLNLFGLLSHLTYKIF
jgi:hypothetical protein